MDDAKKSITVMQETLMKERLEVTKSQEDLKSVREMMASLNTRLEKEKQRTVKTVEETEVYESYIETIYSEQVDVHHTTFEIGIDKDSEKALENIAGLQGYIAELEGSIRSSESQRMQTAEAQMELSMMIQQISTSMTETRAKLLNIQAQTQAAVA